MAALNGKPYDVEYRILAGGAVKWLRAKSYLEFSEDGSLRGGFGVVQDISERKQAEIALNESNRQKDEFLAMLAHELRNPLTPISNIAQILSSTSLTGTAMTHAVEMLSRSVAQMTHLVDDMLDVARITRGLVAIDRRPLELGKLLKDAVETIQSSFSAKKQTLNLDLPTHPINVAVDPDRLAQVFSNLLINAHKYTGEGGRIDISVITEGQSVVVRIQDNGMGIEPQLLPHIFGLFTQGERGLARSEGGLGLGLTLVKRLVDLHGGEVTAYSQGINQGSEFVVKLPVIVVAAREAEPNPPMKLNPETGKRLRVLMIDDNKDILDSLSLILEMSGHHVETASNGTQGISVAQGFAPDIILLDIGLPDMDGYQVAKKLREEPFAQGVMIVAMSGYIQVTSGQGTDASGFDHYLLKPPKLSELRDLVVRYHRTKQSDGHAPPPLSG